jgi:hypothetical protein
MDGKTRLKEVAPNMIPAEKPRRLSINLGEALLQKKTGRAPTPVASPAPKLASPPNPMTSISVSKSRFPMSNPKNHTNHKKIFQEMINTIWQTSNGTLPK